MMRSERSKVSNNSVVKIAFNAVDKKGRVIGTNVHTAEWDMEVTTNCTAYAIEPGHYFMAEVQASRDGVAFGSSQRNLFFRTAEARDNYVAQRVSDSQKNAQKVGVKPIIDGPMS